MDICCVYQQASRSKRASPTKKPSKEWTFPNKRHVNYNNQVCTVEKLVDQCGYPAKDVERAVIICGESGRTPVVFVIYSFALRKCIWDLLRHFIF